MLACGLVGWGLVWIFKGTNPLPGIIAFAGGLVVLGGVIQFVLGIDKPVPAPEDLPDSDDGTSLTPPEIAYLRGQMVRSLSSARDLAQLVSWQFIIFGGALGVIGGLFQVN